MGFLDDLKGKADELGDKAKEGFDAAKDKAGDLAGDVRAHADDLVDGVRDRLGNDKPDAYDEVLQQTEAKRAAAPDPSDPTAPTV